MLIFRTSTLTLGAILAAALVAPANASAGPKKSEGGNFGLGGMLGNPTGGTGKWFIRGSAHAIQFGVGWAWLGPAGIGHAGRAHLDWTWHPGTLASNDVVDVVPYVGLGFGSGLWRQGRHGAGNKGCGDPPFERGYCDDLHYHAYAFGRAPVVGLALHWQEVPLDTFVEGAWTPGLNFDHEGDIDPLFLMGDFAVGVRWYF